MLGLLVEVLGVVEECGKFSVISILYVLKNLWELFYKWKIVLCNIEKNIVQGKQTKTNMIIRLPKSGT